MMKRIGAGLMFAPLGFVSLVLADKVSQLLCAFLFSCKENGDGCPIDVCVGDARVNLVRIAIWFGPAMVFGTSAFLFSGRRRPLGAWLVLLVALVVVHALIMTVAR